MVVEGTVTFPLLKTFKFVFSMMLFPFFWFSMVSLRQVSRSEIVNRSRSNLRKIFESNTFVVRLLTTNTKKNEDKQANKRIKKPLSFWEWTGRVLYCCSYWPLSSTQLLGTGPQALALRLGILSLVRSLPAICPKPLQMEAEKVSSCVIYVYKCSRPWYQAD